MVPFVPKEPVWNFDMNENINLSLRRCQCSVLARGNNTMKQYSLSWTRYVPQITPALMLGIVLSVVQPASAASTAEATATVNITWTVVAPSCELKVPDKVYLGNITYGSKAYPPFTITVNCTSAAKAEIYAQTVTGALVSGLTHTLAMVGKDSEAQFWLEDNNRKIPLNGETNDVDSGFCLGENSRTCTLTPNTWVTTKAQEGERSAVIRFNLRYKA